MRKAHALGVVAAAAVLAAFFHAPIPQDLAYHAFADTRSFAGIPNVWDVLSNLPFLAVGLYGLTRRVQPKTAYLTLCGGVLLVSLGSAYYHYAPSNETLLWDRLPMTIAFMALFSMLLEERVTHRKTLIPLLALGLASAFYWSWTDDLRPYLLVQFLPLLLLPLILALYAPRYLSTRLLLCAFGLYVAAKLFEHYDRSVLAWLPLSGHTIKHLVSGAATLSLVLAVPAKKEEACSSA